MSVLGASGAYLGWAGRNGSRKSIAAFVLGLLAIIGFVAITVGDQLTHPSA
jgi:hypothetical protein